MPATATRSPLPWLALGLVWALHDLGMLMPSTLLWSVDPLRFLPAPLAWALPLAVLAVLALARGDRWAAAADAAGDALGGSGTAWALGALEGALLLACPDRLHLTGDFELRLSIARASGSAARVLPQAQPLDVLLHQVLPHALASRHLLHVEDTARVLGALAAVGVIPGAAALARAANLRGAGRLACVGLLALGAPLALFCGLPKPFALLVVLTVWTAASALATLRTGERPLLPLLFAVLALALHRSGLALLPVAALAAWRALARPGARVTPAALAALVALFVLGAWALRDALVAMAHVDAPRALLWPLAPGATAGLRLRLADLANLALLLVPAWLLLPRGSSDESRAWTWALALPALAQLLLLDAPQGYVRDWDMFAAAGTALTAIAAVRIGGALANAPAARARVWALLAIVLLGSVPLLLVNHERDRGIERVLAFVRGGPPRDDALRARLLFFAAERLDDDDEDARARPIMLESLRLAPSPSARKLLQRIGSGAGGAPR